MVFIELPITKIVIIPDKTMIILTWSSPEHLPRLHIALAVFKRVSATQILGKTAIISGMPWGSDIFSVTLHPECERTP